MGGKANYKRYSQKLSVIIQSEDELVDEVPLHRIEHGLDPYYYISNVIKNRYVILTYLKMYLFWDSKFLNSLE